MRRTLATMLFCATALAVLAGCGGKVRYPNYYTLDLPAPPDPPAAEKARSTLAVREFRAPNYLRQGSIVYKTSPEQLDFYAYHRWARDPRDFVTSSVMDRLRSSGIFAHVKPYDGSRDTDYILSGRLEKLEELDYQGDSVKVQIAITADLTSIATGATVWANSVSEIGDVRQRGVPAVVAEMNRTMQRAIEKLLATIPQGVAASRTAALKN